MTNQMVDRTVFQKTEEEKQLLKKLKQEFKTQPKTLNHEPNNRSGQEKRDN
jgi:hypothetical protein